MRFPKFAEVDGAVVLGSPPPVESTKFVAENSIFLLVQEDAAKPLTRTRMARREAKRLRGAPGVLLWLRALLRDAPETIRKLPLAYKILAKGLDPLSADAVVHPSVAPRLAEVAA